MRAICFTPTVWNVNLTPKDPCRNTQNHIWPNIWAAHGPVKLTHNITHYREDWRGPTGLAGITSALLWPVQGRVFCWAILETLHKGQILFPKWEVGAVTRRKEKGYQGTAGPFVQRVSLGPCFYGVNIKTQLSALTASLGSSLCERGAVRMRKEIISVLLPLLFQSPSGVTFEGRPMETCAHDWALKTLAHSEKVHPRQPRPM